MKMTDLRRLLLHGILESGPRPTALEIWETLGTMTGGHAPTRASVQRMLNLLIGHHILTRMVGSDRVWRYEASSEYAPCPAVTLTDVAGGVILPYEASEIGSLLHQIVAERGYSLHAAAITVAVSSEVATPVE